MDTPPQDTLTPTSEPQASPTPDIPSYNEYVARTPDLDPMDRIRKYRGEVNVGLLRSGQYTPELAADVDRNLMEKAQAGGYIAPDDPAPEKTFLGAPDPAADANLAHRHALDTGNTDAREASAAYAAALSPHVQSSFSSPDEYLQHVSDASQTFHAVVPPAAVNDARRAALDRGDLPFASFTDDKGNERVELGPQMKGITDKGLADMFTANPNLDRRLIPQVRAKLATPEGFTSPVFELERQNDFFAGISPIVKDDPSLQNHVRAVASAISKNETGNLTPALETMDLALASTPFHQQFSKEERMTFLQDYATQRFDPPRLDTKNVDANLRTLSTGEVVVPSKVLMSKPMFDRTMTESTLIPEVQKQAILKNRDEVVSQFAPDAFQTITARRPEFVNQYAQEKAQGKSDVQILDDYTSDPKHQGVGYEWVSGLTESVPSAILGGVLTIPAISGSKTSLSILQYLDKSNLQRKQFTNLMGKDLGASYDVATMIAPIAVDILATHGAASAVRATVGEIGKAAVKPVLRSFFNAALDKGTGNLMENFARGMARTALTTEAKDASLGISKAAIKTVARDLSPSEVLDYAAKDLTHTLDRAGMNASIFAVQFNRQAGQTYVTMSSALDGMKNPDGSARYTPEQVRDIAMKHSLIQGTVTGLVTLGFQAIGRPGLEQIFDGGMTQKQLGAVHRRLVADWAQFAPAAREGIDLTTANSMMTSMMAKSLKPIWQIATKGAVEQIPEGAIQQFARDMDDSYAKGEKFDPVQSLKSSVYMGMLSGVMGGLSTAGHQVVSSEAVSAQQEHSYRRSVLLESATKLDEHAPKTAAVLREAAMRGMPPAREGGDTGSNATPPATEGGVPEGAAPEGSQPPPGGPELAADGTPVAAEVNPNTSESVPEQTDTFTHDATPEQMMQGVDHARETLKAHPEHGSVVEGRTVRADAAPEVHQVDAALAETKASLEHHVVKEEAPEAAPSGEPAVAGTEDVAPPKVGNTGAIPTEEESARWDAAEAYIRPRVEAMSHESLDAFGAVAGVKRQGVSDEAYRAKILGNNHPDDLLDALAATQSPETVPAEAVRDATKPGQMEESPTPETPNPEPAEAPKTQTRKPGVPVVGDTIAFESTIPGAPKEGVVTEVRPDGTALVQHGKNVIPVRPEKITNVTPKPEGIHAIPDEVIDATLKAAGHEPTDAQRTVANVLSGENPIPYAMESEDHAAAAMRETLKESFPDVETGPLDTMDILTKMPVKSHDVVDTLTKSSLDATRKALESRDSKPTKPLGKQNNPVVRELNEHNFDAGIPGFLKSVSETGPEHLRPVAKMLLKFPGLLESTPVTKVHAPADEFAGVFVPQTGQVLINTARMGPRGGTDTVVHELLHAATEHAIVNPTPEQAHILKRLDAIRRNVSKRAEAGGLDHLKYGLSSNSEFVTHFFTSPKFQNDVTSLTPKGERSLFHVVVDAIRDLLGMKNRVTTEIMSDLVKLTESAAGEHGISRMDALLQIPEGPMRDTAASGEFRKPGDEFDHEVGKYITGKWPEDPAERFGEASRFADDWLLRSEQGFNRLGWLLRRVPLRPDTIGKQSQATISPDGKIHIDVSDAVIAKAATTYGGNERAVKTYIAKVIEEETIHAAYLESQKRRFSNSENYVTSVWYDTADTFRGIVDESRVNPEVARVVESSWAAYTDSKTPKTAEQMWNELTPTQHLSVVGEMVRQIVQLRKSGDITETHTANLFDKMTNWLKGYWDALKLASQNLGMMGRKFESDVTNTEKVLDDLGVRFQPIETKSPNEIENYATGKWPEDPEGKFEELRNFTLGEFDRRATQEQSKVLPIHQDSGETNGGRIGGGELVQNIRTEAQEPGSGTNPVGSEGDPTEEGAFKESEAIPQTEGRQTLHSQRSLGYKNLSGTVIENYIREIANTKGLTEFEAKTRVRELLQDPRTRILSELGPPVGTNKVNVGGAHIELVQDGGRLKASIEVPEGLRKQGVATAAMTKLTDLAKRDGVTVDLDVQPLGNDEAMSKERLTEWYSKLGFHDNGDGTMTKYPNPVKGSFEREGKPLFQFAGEGAVKDQFREDSLDTAKAMAAAGKSSEEIRAVTGWFPGKYDGKMRWEIPDNGAKLKPLARKGRLAIATERVKEQGYTGDIASSSTPESVRNDALKWADENPEKFTLGQILDHPALFEAYPDAENIPVEFNSDPKLQGSFNPATGVITVSEGRIDEAADRKLSTILHETQHWIQQKEGTAKGASPEKFAGNNLQLMVNKQRYIYSLKPTLALLERIGPVTDAKIEQMTEEEKTTVSPAWNDQTETWKTADDIRAQIDQTQKELDNIDFDGSESYNRTAGEIEARDVQARANMTPEQLAATAPYSSENIAPEHAIVRFQPTEEEVKPTTKALNATLRGMKTISNILRGTGKSRAIRDLESLGAVDAGTQHVGARVYSPILVKLLNHEVFGEHVKDEAFKTKFGETVVADNILGGYDSLQNRLAYLQDEPQEKLSLGEKREMTDLQTRIANIEESQDLEGLNKLVNENSQDPEILAAIRRYETTVTPQADQLYSEMKALDPTTEQEGRGRYFDARVNLLSKESEAKLADFVNVDKAMPQLKSSNYVNPSVKRDKFDRRAALTGEYSTNLENMMLNSFGSRINEVTKLRFYKALEDSGKARILAEGEATPEMIGGDRARVLQIRRPKTVDGKTTGVYQRMVVPEYAVETLRRVLDTDMTAKSNPVFQALTKLQVLGVADAVAHTKNQISLVTHLMGRDKNWQAVVAKIPILGTIQSMVEIRNVAQKVAAGDPEILKEIADLAKNAMLRNPQSHEGWKKYTPGSFLHDNDTAVRVILARRYANLVEAKIAPDTIEGKRGFVMQLGEYNRRLMGAVEAGMRDYGFSPFLVAGKTLGQFASRVSFGEPGFTPTSTKAAIQARATMMAPLLSATVTAVMANMFFTGNPFGRKGTKVGSIDLGPDYDDQKGMRKTIDLLQISGIRRGLSRVGLDAPLNNLNSDSPANTVIGDMISDAVQTNLHPYMGPAGGALFEILTGKQLSMRQGFSHSFETRNFDGGQQYLENGRAAFKHLNPAIYSLAEPVTGAILGAAGMTMPGDEGSYGHKVGGTLMKAPASAFGYREEYSPAMKLAKTISAENAKAAPMDEKQLAKWAEKVKIYEAINKGEHVDFASAIKSKTIKPNQINQIMRLSRMTPLQRSVFHMNAEQLGDIYNLATPEEQKELHGMLVQKRAKEHVPVEG